MEMQEGNRKKVATEVRYLTCDSLLSPRQAPCLCFPPPKLPVHPFPRCESLIFQLQAEGKATTSRVSLEHKRDGPALSGSLHPTSQLSTPPSLKTLEPQESAHLGSLGSQRVAGLSEDGALGRTSGRWVWIWSKGARGRAKARMYKGAGFSPGR